MATASNFCSSQFDDAFSKTTELTWLPWVGENYGNLPQGRRVLVVGESHYAGWDNPEDAGKSISELEAYQEFTREVVHESLVHNKWTTRTLSTIHQLFYSPSDRNTLWSDLCFYNFVQRAMNYSGGSSERPTWKDFYDAWGVFLNVVEILKPDHILFIGVEAANHFGNYMNDHKVAHTDVSKVEKVGSTYARSASVEVADRNYPIHFIKHCGSYFSTWRWHDYLHANARDLMGSLALSAKSTLPDPEAPKVKTLHVLGMAKSSLDLNGAKRQKLELDFLRLAFAVRELRESGDEAIGYLMVLDDNVALAAVKWIDQYQTGEDVMVLCCCPTPSDISPLLTEKANNAVGFLPAKFLADHERKLAIADFGKQLGESHLREAIEERHKGVETLHDVLTRESLPLHIQWDFYGTLPIQG